LDSLTIGDHHTMNVPYYQNTPMLGRLLAEWGGRPAGCLFLLPLWNPVLVAEHIGTLAALHDGPFVVQTGIGDGAKQFAAMGATLADRGRATDDAIAVVKALLAGEAVNGASIALRPVEPVQWWVGGGPTTAPLRRAARDGDAWYAGPNLDQAGAADGMARYQDLCASFGRTPTAKLRRDVIILPDGDEARRLGRALVEAGYRGLTMEHVVCGSPPEVAERLAPFAEFGFDEIVARAMTVPQEVALATAAGLGEVRSLLAR
jgi:alkanesulfonate monooxygenase SsuD/methylene tetrahydromethanopterin reductase-like flavin-dependent oxidoreductase (luciferase family)